MREDLTRFIIHMDECPGRNPEENYFRFNACLVTVSAKFIEIQVLIYLMVHNSHMPHCPTVND